MRDGGALPLWLCFDSSLFTEEIDMKLCGIVPSFGMAVLLQHQGGPAGLGVFYAMSVVRLRRRALPESRFPGNF